MATNSCERESARVLQSLVGGWAEDEQRRSRVGLLVSATRAALAVAAVVISACTGNPGEVCGASGELLCAPGLVCAPNGAECADPGAIRACRDLGAGDACTTPTAENGICINGVCRAGCGNSTIDPGEDCDRANLNDQSCEDVGFHGGTLGCTDRCSFDSSQCVGECGDGQVDDGFELCDGSPEGTACLTLAYDRGTVGCSDSCSRDLSTCGFLGFGEVSDSGIGKRLTPIAMFSDSDVYLYQRGDFLVVHYNGSDWEVLPAVPRTSLDDKIEGAWVGDAASIVVATDAGQIVRFDGSAWTVVDTAGAAPAAFSALWGNTDGALVAVGDNTILLSTDAGLSWAAIPHTLSGSLRSVWGTSAQHFVVGTDSGDIGVYTSDVWDIESVSGDPIPAIWGDGATVFAIANSDPSELLEYTGDAWSKVADMPPVLRPITGVEVKQKWESLAGTGRHNLMAVAALAGYVYIYDGSTWTPQIAALQGAQRGTLVHAGRFYVNHVGALYVYDGSHWEDLDGWDLLVGALWSGDGVVLAGSQFSAFNSSIAVRELGTWQTHNANDTLDDKHPNYHAAHGWDRDHLFVGDDRGRIFSRISGVWGSPYQYAGLEAGVIGKLSGNANGMYALVCLGADVSCPGTGSSVLEYIGNDTWIDVVPPQGEIFAGIWVSETGTLWASGTAGVLWKYDGSVWTSYASGSLSLGPLWGSSDDSIFVSTTEGKIRYSDGSNLDTSWDMGGAPRAIAGNSANDVMTIVGVTDLLYFDGIDWAPVRNDEPIQQLAASGNRFHVGTRGVRLLERRRAWSCSATEAICNDSIDNDCDGLFDGDDGDCP